MNLQKVLSKILIFAMVMTVGLSGSYAETGSTIPTFGSAAAENAGSDAKTTSSGARAAAFSDIKDHWAGKIISEAAELKIVGGYPDGTFLPDNLIKREEFYKLLSNILTVKPDTSSTVIRFSDVVEDEWYVPTIKIAVASGITSGYGDGTFGIGLMISRQEAAKVAGSVITSDVNDTAPGAGSALDKGFIANWAYEYVDLMFKKGYMKGDTEGNFRPTMALTRAEAATILLNIKKNETIIAANADSLVGSKCLSVHSIQEGAFTAGNGTQAEPYEINTEAQLNHIREHAAQGAFYILKKNIAVTEDYAKTAPKDMDDPDWSEGNFEPIGSKQAPFDGNLDGNGYTISGLNIIGTQGRGDEKRGADYAGLFGYLSEDSAVTDLIIDASSVSGNKYTGAVAGYSEGKVKDCQLGRKGIVKGITDTGGLVGYSSGPLSSLRNQGSVSGKINTGGIVGTICAQETAMRYSQNEGTVTGTEKTGGIAGTFTSAPESESFINECYNKGTVKGETHTGGITGYTGAGYYKATVENCGNTGEITGSGTVGGISGILDKGKSYIIRCVNSGTVEGGSAGGIAGHNRGTISFCYSSGSVKGNMDGGGIAAYQTDGDGIIEKCYNEGSVHASSYSGGIIGQNDSRVEYSYNSGKVCASGTSGGIAGKNTATVRYVYDSGIVTGEKNSGSLIGRNSAVLDTAFWLNTTNDTAAGLEDPASKQTNVMRVTHEELSGQQKIKQQNGYEMLINVLNGKTKSWEYRYKILIPAPGNTNVISDGGNIVHPLEVQSADSTGNTIDPADLSTKYLYPVLID